MKTVWLKRNKEILFASHEWEWVDKAVDATIFPTYEQADEMAHKFPHAYAVTVEQEEPKHHHHHNHHIPDRPISQMDAYDHWEKENET